MNGILQPPAPRAPHRGQRSNRRNRLSSLAPTPRWGRRILTKNSWWTSSCFLRIWRKREKKEWRVMQKSPSSPPGAVIRKRWDKKISSKKISNLFFLQLDPQEGMLRSLCLPQLQVGKSKKIKKTNFFFSVQGPKGQRFLQGWLWVRSGRKTSVSSPSFLSASSLLHLFLYCSSSTSYLFS